MSRNDPSTNLVDNLIEQDKGVSESQFEEFRMNLERSLASLEQRAQSSRFTSIASVVAVVVCYVLAMALNLTQEVTPRWLHNTIGLILVVCANIALITAGISISRYVSMHRPALERGKTDLQIAMFGELQRQMTQLIERLDKLPRP